MMKGKDETGAAAGPPDPAAVTERLRDADSRITDVIDWMGRARDAFADLAPAGRLADEDLELLDNGADALAKTDTVLALLRDIARILELRLRPAPPAEPGRDGGDSVPAGSVRLLGDGEILAAFESHRDNGIIDSVRASRFLTGKWVISAGGTAVRLDRAQASAWLAGAGAVLPMTVARLRAESAEG
jgi:hypothetical protein